MKEKEIIKLQNKKELKLTKKELNKISKNFKMTFHAKDRINERLALVDNQKQIVAEMIRNSKFAYTNTNGQINVAINEYEYFIIEWNRQRDTYALITVMEKSKNNYTIYDKYKLALKGVKKK